MAEILSTTQGSMRMAGRSMARRARGRLAASAITTANTPYGWYVGWARKNGRELVFARLIQDEKAARPNAGMRAREQLLAGLPGWLGAAGQR